MDPWSVDLLGERFIVHYAIEGYTELAVSNAMVDGQFVRNGTERFHSVLHQVREPIVDDRVVGVQKCVGFRELTDITRWVPHRLGMWTLFHSWLMDCGTVVDAVKELVLFLESLGVARKLQMVEYFPGGVHGLSADNEGQRAALRWLPEENVVEGSEEFTFWGVGTRGACGPSMHWMIQREDSSQWFPVASITHLMYHRVPSERIQTLGRHFVRTSVNGEWLQCFLNGQKHLHDSPDRWPLLHLIEMTAYALPLCGASLCVQTAYYHLVDLLLFVVYALSEGVLPENGKMLRQAIQCGVQLCHRHFGMDMDDEQTQLFMHTLAMQACVVLGIRWRDDIGKLLRGEECLASRSQAVQ